MNRRSEANKPRRHVFRLDVDGEDDFSSADIWPGDLVDLVLPNGLVVFMKANADGLSEFI